jgi:hypothetical protein
LAATPVAGHKDIYPTIDQFGCKSRQLIVSALGPAKFDRDVATFDKARPSQAVAERSDAVGKWTGRSHSEKANGRHRGEPLLRKRGARGHDAAVPPSNVMKSRRRMCPPERARCHCTKPSTLRGAAREKGH